MLSVNLVPSVQLPHTSETVATLRHSDMATVETISPVKEAVVPSLVTATPVEDRYFRFYEVDTRAELAFSELVSAVDSVNSSDIKGKVKVRVLINADGKVDEVNVLEAEPVNIFNGVVLNALLNSRFTPAIKDGRKVKSQKIIEINFGTPG